jgi:hypothetical protein
VLAGFPGYCCWDGDFDEFFYFFVAVVIVATAREKGDLCCVQAVEEIGFAPGVDDRKEVYCASGDEVVPELVRNTQL